MVYRQFSAGISPSKFPSRGRQISLTRKFQPPREVDKSASGEEISPSYSMAKIFHECQNNFVSLHPKTIVKKHLLWYLSIQRRWKTNGGEFPFYGVHCRYFWHLYSFLVLIVGFMVDSSNIWDVVFLPIPLLLPLCLVYYNLDEGIWQLTGKEICECDDKGIVITKHRLFKRQKYIPWSEITKIYLYSPNIYLELLRLIYFHQNFYEIKSQSI